MKQINLLPWRQKAREAQRNIFDEWMVFSAIIGVIVVFLMFMYARNQVSDANAAIKYLKEEIEVCNKKVKQIAKYKEMKEVLVSRMKVVQALQSTRALTVHLFDELVSIIPEGIDLDMVKREGTLITLKGSADSNSNVSTLMNNIMKSQWIYHPALKIIKRPTDQKPQGQNTEISYSLTASEFELTFTVEPKSDKKTKPKGQHGSKQPK